jgi:hypothetical protein
MAIIKKLIFDFDEENNRIYSMAVFLPGSKPIDDTVHFENWNRAIWGTKWDAIESVISENNSTLIIFYRTAWEPNLTWVELFCSFLNFKIKDFIKKEKELNIKIEHWYWELGLDFGGITKWCPEAEFKHKHYNSSLEFAKEHDEKLYEYRLRLKNNGYY